MLWGFLKEITSHITTLTMRIKGPSMNHIKVLLCIPDMENKVLKHLNVK